MIGDSAMSSSRPIVCLANGNLNGRVARLVADGLHHRIGSPVRLISTTRLHALECWPEERAQPHVLTPEIVDAEEAVRAVQDAAVFVMPPFWDRWTQDLIGKARRAGTPVVAVVADVGYGARKLDTSDEARLPHRICVGDPITRGLLIRNGTPASIIRNTGNPYFDAVLSERPTSGPGHPRRVGVFANPDGVHERVRGSNVTTPEGVLPALSQALRAFPDAQITVRLHPRQNLDRIGEMFPLPESAVFDSLDPASPVSEFIAAHDLVVGSYSTGLIVARLLGRPAVSFQPPMGDNDGLRREIFAAWDVPVATDDVTFAAYIAERLEFAGPALDPKKVLYHPGESLDVITSVVREMRSLGHDEIVRSVTQVS
jgi:hypothetical protein